mgnify:CR=1 FL=1
MNYYAYRKKIGILRRLKNISITAWLIALTTIISITALILIKAYCPAISDACSVLDFLALKPSNILQGKFLWTLILHMFVHGGITHLFVNMFVLFSLGGLIERIIGKKRYFWFYILSGLFAGVLSVLLASFLGNTELGARIFGSPEIFMVGASGAIFAIAGLYVMLLPKIRFMIIFLPFFTLPAYIMIPLALFGVWLATILTGLPIGNVAHFGGFLAGVTYGLYLRAKYKRKVKILQKMFR